MSLRILGGAVGGQINARKSFNAESASVAIAGDGGHHKVVSTGIPKLRAAESGASAVTDSLASSFLARARFQVLSVTAPEPTVFVAELNFRNVSDDAIASNLGFWYVVTSGSGSVATLELIDFEWPYVPYNNIPTALIEVGDGSAYTMSLDLRLNSGAGGITVINGMIVVEAGNFYTPGTTQIGNSAAPGPIGSL